MELPVLNGLIDRRILVNYRVEPDVVKSLLPSYLEPLVINGYASAAICLLRLKNIGMKYSPSFLRITSENAAHRFLVKYTKGNEEGTAVFIPRRDTDSILNVVLAGKMFSWPHYSASFLVKEANGNYCVKMQSKDHHSMVQVEAQLSDTFPSKSMFDSLDHASDCFHGCAVGISPSAQVSKVKTIKLKTKTWYVKPLHISFLKSSYFENKSLFPEGSIEFDNGILMEGIEHEWLSKSDGCYIGPQ
jgi:hypothetical protein